MSKKKLQMPYVNQNINELLDYLMKRLAAEKQWKMSQTLDYLAYQTHYFIDALQAIRRGRFVPQTKTILTFLDIGRRVGLDREWGTAVAEIHRHLDTFWAPDQTAPLQLHFDNYEQPPLNLKMTTELATNNVIVLQLGGSFNSSAAHFIMLWLERTGKQQHANIVLDLADLTEFHFDAPGVLDALLYGVYLTREFGGDLALCNLPPARQADFEICGLDMAIQVHSDVETAVNTFAS